MMPMGSGRQGIGEGKHEASCPLDCAEPATLGWDFEPLECEAWAQRSGWSTDRKQDIAGSNSLEQRGPPARCLSMIVLST